MNKNFYEIIKHKKTCYFISPHLDDAYLSSGALMQYLSKRTRVTVVNVFSKAGNGPHTMSAKKNLLLNGYESQEKLYSDRRAEDLKVYSKLKINVINLGFVEALWRQKRNPNIFIKLWSYAIPELIHIYPTYKYHIVKGKISKNDLHTIREIKKKLSHLEKDAVIFCPVGVGNHVDHVLVKRVCEEMFENPIFWSDFPYNLNKKNHKPAGNTYTFSKYLQNKIKNAQGYKTQIGSMFPKGKIPKKNEIFYL